MRTTDRRGQPAAAWKRERTASPLLGAELEHLEAEARTSRIDADRLAAGPPERTPPEEAAARAALLGPPCPECGRPSKGRSRLCPERTHAPEPGAAEDPMLGEAQAIDFEGGPEEAAAAFVERMLRIDRLIADGSLPPSAAVAANEQERMRKGEIAGFDAPAAFLLGLQGAGLTDARAGLRTAALCLECRRRPVAPRRGATTCTECRQPPDTTACLTCAALTTEGAYCDACTAAFAAAGRRRLNAEDARAEFAGAAR